MPASSSIKLQPADPFDLVRWLARSQSVPRKAVAGLVQNSLDANARRVTIERRRVRRSPSLVIRDDGEGILSPRERHEQVVAGKYGIGLLGFWSIGHHIALRGEPRTRLRYLLALFAKEIAFHARGVHRPLPRIKGKDQVQVQGSLLPDPTLELELDPFP